MCPLLVVLFGPPLVVIWVRGSAWRWRGTAGCGSSSSPSRCCWCSPSSRGAQPHYPVFLLPLPSRPGSWRWSDISAGSGRPCSPSTARCPPSRAAARAVGSVGATPVPGDQPAGAATPSAGRRTSARSPTCTTRCRTASHAAVFTSNYGEAGAVHHYAARRSGLQRAERALRPGPAAGLGHDPGGRRRPVPGRPRAVRPVHGPRPARQRGRRRQRGAGAADRRLHRPRRRLGRALAAAAPPRLRHPGATASVGS